MELRGKTIVIISQQEWGEMFISKSHYAVELAKMGNKVYYMPGPDQQRKLSPGEIKITPLSYEGVYNVEHRFFFPYILKFKARKLYDRLLVHHVNRLLKKIGKVDVVISYDLSDTITLRSFPSSVRKIYMPVDELKEEVAVKAAVTADIVFSITHEILTKFNSLPIPKVFLNHGVAESFINTNITTKQNDPIQVGLSGNFLRPDLDRDTMLEIIKENPEVVFNLWGSTNYKTSNLTPAYDKEAADFIDALKANANVILHGQLAPKQLAEELNRVDCFLICYDIEKDQSKGTNYHKILEYLATGKVVVSNNVTTYTKYPGMLEMTTDRTNNKELPGLMKKVLNDLPAYNSIERQQARIDLVKQFTYPNQVKKIEAALTAHSL